MTQQARDEAVATGSAASPGVPDRRRAITAGTLGNLVEWFDWNAYAFFAPFFAAQFFPQGSEVAGLLNTFAVFAIGFFLRPLGGAVLGSFADRHGRKAGMTLTIALMAGGSLLIAVLPTHAMVGVWAPALLVVARAVQGFSAGGEFGTSSAYMVENAATGRRATVGAWQQVSVGLGTLLAALLAGVMSSVLTPAQMTTWGWRAAFGLGAVLGLVGLYLRLRVDDTPVFDQVRHEGRRVRQPLTRVLREHPRAALRVVAMVAAGTALVQLWFASLPSLAKVLVDAPVKTGQYAATIALAVFTVLLPLTGSLSDRFGRRPMLLVFAVGSAVTLGPALLLMRPTLAGVAIPAAVSGALLASYAGSLAAMMAEQFPPEVRTAGISLPYGIAVAVFGGTTPYVAMGLVSQGLVWVFVAVMTGLCLASAAVFWRMRETAHAQIDPPRPADGRPVDA